MPIKFAVKRVRLKDYYDHCQSDGLGLYSRSQVRLKLDCFLTCNTSDIPWVITFKLGKTVDLWIALYVRARFDDLDLDARSHSGSTKATTKISVSCSRQLSKSISIKLTTTTAFFLRDLDVDFANVYIWLVAALIRPPRLAGRRKPFSFAFGA